MATATRRNDRFTWKAGDVEIIGPDGKKLPPLKKKAAAPAKKKTRKSGK